MPDLPTASRTNNRSLAAAEAATGKMRLSAVYQMADHLEIRVRTVGNGRTRAHAKAMLASMKPYDDWIRTVDLARREEAKRVFGDPFKFYGSFGAELVKIAEEGQVREIRFSQNGAVKEVVIER